MTLTPRTPARLLPPLAAVAGLAVLAAGCNREDLYGDNTFTENVAEAYADCSDAEIRFLASKNGIQTAFENCGSNRFGAFTWSPEGQFLYFQLTHGGHVLDGENKTITTVPTEVPIGEAAWLRDDLLVVPLGPKAAPGDPTPRALDALEAEEPTSSLPTEPAPPATTGIDVDGPTRLAIWNRTANTLNVVAVQIQSPRDLQRWTTDDHVLLTAVDSTGARHPYAVELATGRATRAFAWLEAPVERLVYVPEANMVSWSDGKDSELHSAEDGHSIALLPGVKRAVPHKGGRYVALEVDGAKISPFDQRAWNEISEESRKRELARQEKWLERQPDWVVKEIVPPEVQILDLTKNERYRVTNFYGDRFEWYRARDYFCSFMLWGIEGKQLNRNVALVDLAERLRMLDKGETPLGIERLGAEPTGAPATGPGSDAPTPQPPG